MATSSKSNPGHVGRRRVQSPLWHPCSPTLRKSNLFLVHVMRIWTGRFFCLSWSENAENCLHVDYLASMFKQAHGTRRRKRFHSLHRPMLGRFRILAYAALNEKDKEQSQTFHSFSVVQQGFESPATLRLKATSRLTSSWIKHRFDTTLAKPRDSTPPEPSQYFPLLFPPRGSRMRKRFLSHSEFRFPF